MYSHGKQLVLFFGAVLATSFVPFALAQSAEEQAVLTPIHAMFDGMSKRDAAAIKAPTLPGEMNFGAANGAARNESRPHENSAHRVSIQTDAQANGRPVPERCYRVLLDVRALASRRIADSKAA